MKDIYNISQKVAKLIAKDFNSQEAYGGVAAEYNTKTGESISWDCPECSNWNGQDYISVSKGDEDTICITGIFSGSDEKCHRLKELGLEWYEVQSAGGINKEAMEIAEKRARINANETVTQQEIEQFEKEGFAIVADTEAGVDYYNAQFKGHHLGVIYQEEAVHPDAQVAKSDATILSEFGGLDYFKKEFAEEIELAEKRERISQNIAALDSEVEDERQSEEELEA